MSPAWNWRDLKQRTGRRYSLISPILGFPVKWDEIREDPEKRDFTGKREFSFLAPFSLKEILHERTRLSFIAITSQYISRRIIFIGKYGKTKINNYKWSKNMLFLLIKKIYLCEYMGDYNSTVIPYSSLYKSSNSSHILSLKVLKLWVISCGLIFIPATPSPQMNKIWKSGINCHSPVCA